MKYSNRVFENETVDVDGNFYDYCTFKGCVLRYSGGDPPSFRDCTCPGEYQWKFDGPALSTLHTLAGFWQTDDRMFRNIASRAVQIIVTGQLKDNRI